MDPCDDFYEFSCGGWLDSQVIPDDRTSVSVFSQLQDDLNHKLRSEKKCTRVDPSVPTINCLNQVSNLLISQSRLTQF